MSQRRGVKRELSIMLDTPRQSQRRRSQAMRAAAKPFKAVSGHDNKKIKHPYHSSYDFNVANNTPKHWVFRGNGMFDPDYAVGGHQPLGFDQYSALYQQFFVHRATMMTNVSCPDQVSNRRVYVWADTTPNAPADDDNAGEICATNGGKMVTIGNQYFGLAKAKVVGSTKKITDYGMSDPQAAGSPAADPSEVWYFHIYMTIQQADATTHSYRLDTDINYDAEWFDALKLGSS